MAIIGPYRVFIVAAALCVAAASYIAAIPVAAIGFIRGLFVGLVDARPFRELFETPSIVLVGPSGSQIDRSLWHRNRHEAGLARLGAVRHT
jgi:hypothetical protein